MKDIIYSIISGAIAGGIVGQITSIILTNSLTRKRELEDWLRQEKHKTFSELLATTSAVVTREENEDFTNWPDEIRVLSQRVHILFPKGIAPDEISEGLERLFQLSLSRKLGGINDPKKWRHEIRDEVRDLRISFAKALLKR